MRRVMALALRKGGWAVLCSVAIGLLPGAVTPAQAKKPVRTVRAGTKFSAKATPAKRVAHAGVRGKSRPLAKIDKSRHHRHALAKSSRAGRWQLTQARRRVRFEFPARQSAAVATAPALTWSGDPIGLRPTGTDPVQLQSNSALVLDQDNNQVLLNKNDQAVQPIASLTKLMTGLIIAEAKLPMDQPITIMPEDVDTLKHSRSRLAVGTTLTRGEMLHLALMSSENRAAHALGRTYPGGLNLFVALMNARAASLGMKGTHYVEPTGLSSENRSSASDLAKLVAAASQEPLLRELTTSPGYEVAVGRRVLQYNNSNRLVKNPEWDIGLQKTGFINEAGDCLVMQTRIAGHKLIMVFLDSTSKFSRIADAERVRRWVEARVQNEAPHVVTVTRVARADGWETVQPCNAASSRGRRPIGTRTDLACAF
jgi:D-alanyl-D-alanine endopeptidase (penicillin-binding protein 7)